MAIYHLSMKPIARSQGRSSVAASAYRAGEELTNERDGLVHDFSHRKGVVHSQIVLPADRQHEWAMDRSALWNTAEFAEKRKDARTAREFEVALPHELNEGQRLGAVRVFCSDLVERYGTAIDFSIHAPHEDSDVRNHHVHILMTTRQVEENGLGHKSDLERANKDLLRDGLPLAKMQLTYIRQSWEQICNSELARAGHDIRIDHRSHQDRGLEIEPTVHMGVNATQMDRLGLEVERGRMAPGSVAYNAALIKDKPEEVLTLITGERSVFDRHDIAKTLHRYIDEPEEFQAAFASVMGSEALVELQPEGQGRGELARYSTHEMIELERTMVDRAGDMAARSDHGVAERFVGSAIERQDAAIQLAGGDGLSDEQREATRHVTGDERLACVVGLAGAGKSTMLRAAAEAWTAQGYTVHGAALAGKAAEGLEESAGIQSRTLASFEASWKHQRHELGQGDVLVIDEAGMIGSRQMARFVAEAEDKGAKLVLVGDPEQLQAIGAGAAFRGIAERTGFAELEEVRRQSIDWQRDASRDFAKHRTGQALEAYVREGRVRFEETDDQAIEALVTDYMADRDNAPEGSRLALAHRRIDVQAINEAVRGARQGRGELADEVIYETDKGERAFASGDRVLFTENNKDLAVKNGMLGTVEAAEDGRLVVQVDGREGAMSVSMADYAALDHGYATTVHKSQGATVDRAYVLASKSMDRHISYVAMTRHREDVTLYAGKESFKNGFGSLAAAMGRANEKETTLDYGTRRGLGYWQGISKGEERSPLRQAFNQNQSPDESTPSKYGRRFGFRSVKDGQKTRESQQRGRERGTSLER